MSDRTDTNTATDPTRADDVVVTQEDRDLVARLAALTKADGIEAAHQVIARHRLASLPCKSGEGAGAIALSKAVRITAYDRKDPLAIRLEFADDIDRVAAADEIDEILSDAFAAAHLRMSTALDEARENRGGRLIPVRYKALTPDATQTREAEGSGTFVCPICGKDAPHYHAPKVSAEPIQCPECGVGRPGHEGSCSRVTVRTLGPRA